MSVAEDIRAEWDRLIGDKSVWMTKIVIGSQAWRQLMADPNIDHSLDYQGREWTFRTLPIEKVLNYDGWRIETKPCDQ